MYCNKCGKEIEDNSNFCSHCGNSINKPQIIKASVNSSKEQTVKASVKNNKENIIKTIVMIVLLIIAGSAVLYINYLKPKKEAKIQKEQEEARQEKEEKIFLQFTEEKIYADIVENQDKIIEHAGYTGYELYTSCSLEEFNVVVQENDYVTVTVDVCIYQQVGWLDIDGLTLQYKYEDEYRTRYSLIPLDESCMEHAYCHVEYDKAPFLSPNEMDSKIRELGFDRDSGIYAVELITAAEQGWFDNIYSTISSFDKIEYYVQYAYVPDYYDVGSYIYVQVQWDSYIGDWIVTYSFDPCFGHTELGKTKYLSAGRPLNQEELDTVMDYDEPFICP